MSRTDELLAAVAGRRPSSRGWIRANCPFCLFAYGKQDRTYALSLNAISGKWHCFRCGERGFVEPAVLHGGKPTVEEQQPEPAAEVEPPEGFFLLGYGDAVMAASTLVLRDYLLNERRVPMRVWREAGIGTTFRGRFANRVIVPVCRPDDTWVGWVARAVGNHPKRYLNSSGAIPGLFNERALYVDTDEPVVVVEGVFDALPLWPDAVAVLGKPTEQQFNMLLDARRPLAVCLDGDAWVEGEALAWRLQFEGRSAGYVRLPPGKDPDDCRDGLRALARACIAKGASRAVG